MRTKQDFRTEFAALTQRVVNPADPSYGTPVRPFVELYTSLNAEEERGAFQAALDDLLASGDQVKQQRAVDILLGIACL